MSYPPGYSRRSPEDEAAGCAVALILAVITAIVGLFASIFLAQRNKPHLPTLLEGTPKDRPTGFRYWGPVVFGACGAIYLLTSLGGGDGSGPVACLGLVLCASAVVIWKWEDLRAPKTASSPPALTATPRCYTVTLPREQSWQPQIAQRFVEHLAQVVPHMVLRIVAEQGRIQWELLDWRTGVSPETVSQAVHTYYPDADIACVPFEPEGRAYPFYRRTFFFQQASEFVWPVKGVEDLKDFDPLAVLTQAMSGLQAGERITYTLALSVPVSWAQTEGEKMITVSRVKPRHFLSILGAPLALADMVSGPAREEKYRETDQRVARGKLNTSLYQALLAVDIDSPNQGRVEQLANLDIIIWQFEYQPYNALVWSRDAWITQSRVIADPEQDRTLSALGAIRAWVLGTDERWPHARLILSTAELASLWHLPDQRFTAPEIAWTPGRRVLAPGAVVQSAAGIVLGTNIHAGRQSEVRLPYPDRETHVYLLGKTGVGKSTLLHHIIHQDIAAGKGVGVIDPHGELVRNILRYSIPPERENDVVVVDVADTDYPPPLNPFAVPEGVSREVALNQILGVLKKIYTDEWSKTRMESALYAALVALLDDPQATPRDLSRLFLDEGYRQRLLANVTDPVALEYWYEEYNQLSPAMQRQTREPVLNRIRIFYRNAAMRNMVCHPQRLDFHRMVNEGRIFLASLNSDEIRAELANLGALLLANFQMAAMSQPAAAGRAPFYLAIDEVQQFVTTTLPVVFSEARKFGLSLTVANQFLGQLEGETLESILGNVGTVILFACGPHDARLMAALVRPQFEADDLINFDRFHTAVKMQLGGKTQPAFSMSTLPPWFDPAHVPDDAREREARLRREAIVRNGFWPREQVEQWFAERYPRPDTSARVGEVTDYE